MFDEEHVEGSEGSACQNGVAHSQSVSGLHPYEAAKARRCKGTPRNESSRENLEAFHAQVFQLTSLAHNTVKSEVDASPQTVLGFARSQNLDRIDWTRFRNCRTLSARRIVKERMSAGLIDRNELYASMSRASLVRFDLSLDQTKLKAA